MEKKLTEGGVFKAILFFAPPLLLSTFLQTLYGMADLFIIGRFCGVESTTAVSIGSQVMHMLTVMIVGLTMGTTVLISKSVGADNREDVSRAIGNTITVFAAVSVVLTVLLLLLVRPIISVMSTPAGAIEGTAAYLRICFIGIPFITAYNVISAVLRGMGNSKTPMVFVGIACVINIVLDYLFIGVMNLGPAGASLGTTLSQTCSVAIALIYLLRKENGLTLRHRHLKPNGSVIKQLITVGLPIALQDGFIQISFIVITIIANQRGLTDAAAVGIVEKIIGFLFLVPSAMLSTVSALAAQNLGAGKHDRGRKTLGYAVLLSVCFGAVCVLLMQLIPEEFVSLFTRDSEAIFQGGQYMRGYVWDSMIAGVHFCFSGYFCAYGYSWISFLHNSVSILCARIPLAYFASKAFPETLFPMGLAPSVGSILSAGICITVFLILKNKGRFDGVQ